MFRLNGPLHAIHRSTTSLSNLLFWHTQTFPRISLSRQMQVSKGWGAVLSKRQEDGKLHPVSYANRALSKAEENYAITELETLAVVWAISHFHHLVYGHNVTVVTDHSAVKAVLNTPSPSAKHARWWDRVYGCGAKSIDREERMAVPMHFPGHLIYLLR